MIKVIKHGQKVFRVICENCGCEFEYELDDLTEEFDKESLTYGAKVRVIKCPDCGHKIRHRDFTEDKDIVGDKPDIVLQGENPFNPFRNSVPCENHSICEHYTSREDTVEDTITFPRGI